MFKLVWVTSSDSLICPVCQELAGTKYRLDDAPLDTQVESHPNCRCRLLFIEDSS